MIQIGEFVLKNAEKFERAVHGSLTRTGTLSGGVGDAPSNQDSEEFKKWESAVLAEYDKLGGLIVKNGLIVKIGAFYNFVKKQPQLDPHPSFIINVDGENVEGSEEEAASLKTARDRIKQMKSRKKGPPTEEGKLDTTASGIMPKEEREEAEQQGATVEKEAPPATGTPRRSKRRPADGK